MITIVSAAVNTGKSSFLREFFKNFHNADGFVCIKIFADGQHIGYDLVRLSTSETIPFIRKKDSCPQEWDQAAETGRHYSFSRNGFDFAAQIAEEAIDKNCTCFFIDEIGPLELSGKGFAPILAKMISTGIDLVIVIRESIVADAIQCFALKNFKVIHPDTRYL